MVSCRKPLTFIARSACARRSRVHNDFMVPSRGVAFRGLPGQSKVLSISPPTALLEDPPSGGSDDIVVGVIMAVALALFASYLQGLRNNQDVILWVEDVSTTLDDDDEVDLLWVFRTL